GYPVSKLHKKIYETFKDEGKVYSVSQLRRWLSDDNPEVLDAIDAERRDARDKSYANKDSRILALVELASDIFDELVAIDWKQEHKRGTDLLREFRLTMKDLREETDPFGIADQQISSVFENFITKVNFVLEQIKVPVGHGRHRPYGPHDGQKQLHFTDWHYFSAPWGARSGKTIAAAAEVAFTMGLPGTRTWVVAPNYELTDRVFEYVYRWLVIDMIFGQGSVLKASKTKDNRYVEMQWGSFVRGKSAENPDSLAGEQLDLVVFDECARCTEQIFLEFLEGRTLDRKGRVLFISTPRGYNWFRDYFNRGWASRNFPSWDNPYIDQEFLKTKRSETPEDIWKQEYGGEFITQAGLIWPDYKNRMVPDGHIFDPKDFILDKNWNVIRAIDVGVRHPTACLWAAVDEESNVWVYREYEETNPIHPRGSNLNAIRRTCLQNLHQSRRKAKRRTCHPRRTTKPLCS
ncbi:MAG: terminase large subunit domain-containing protein, partial [Planctomycetota bacterium]